MPTQEGKEKGPMSCDSMKRQKKTGFSQCESIFVTIFQYQRRKRSQKRSPCILWPKWVRSPVSNTNTPRPSGNQSSNHIDVTSRRKKTTSSVLEDSRHFAFRLWNTVSVYARTANREHRHISFMFMSSVAIQYMVSVPTDYIPIALEVVEVQVGYFFHITNH